MPLRRTPLPEWALARRTELGQRLTAARVNAGLSQDQVAERTGLERRTIQRYERGERDPRYTDLLLLANALGEPLGHLVCG